MKGIKLTKNDTYFLKGIGILLIIFHNFFHQLQPTIGENEYSFSFDFFKNFIFSISSDPINIIRYFSSYFGHYGVQLFIFCSGYGLTILNYNKIINYKKFIIKRLLKLYPTFTIAIIILLVYQFIIFDFPFTIRTIASVIIRYTLIANLLPGKIFTLSGPYWFYSMIIQLYLLFPYLINLNKRKLISIIIISYILLFISNEFFASFNFSLYYNFIGNMPVFILGILFARNQTIEIRKWKWLIPSLVFILGQFNTYIWYLSQISFVIISFPIILFIYRYIEKSKLSDFIIFSGKISMYLFAIHGFMRHPWVEITNKLDSNLMTYSIFIVFIIIVYLVSILVKKIEENIINKMRKYHIVDQYY